MLSIFDVQSLSIITLFTIAMLYFALKDYKSYDTDNHQDFKSIIVSTGVLGTFVGIFLGLIDFDTTNIKDSVPSLLEGLKTAFVTSIVGMFISISLSAMQKSKGQGQAEDELGILNQINTRLSHLESIANNTKEISTLPLMNTKLDSIDTNIKALSVDISSVKEEMRSNQKMLFEFLEDSLNKVNRTLEETIDVLTEGATKEIIKALENVIQDFNKNLTEQFGDNFKQLNEAVLNMIKWQETYKSSIEKVEAQLKEVITVLDSSSTKLESVATSTEKMSINYSKIDETSSKLTAILETNDNQVKNLETHLKSLAEIGDRAKQSVEQIDKFSDKLQGSLASQSETIHKLTGEIEKQLPKSLDELNKALTTLTNKFRDDYSLFLEQISKLMVTVNRT